MFSFISPLFPFEKKTNDFDKPLNFSSLTRSYLTDNLKRILESSQIDFFVKFSLFENRHISDKSSHLATWRRDGSRELSRYFSVLNNRGWRHDGLALAFKSNRFFANSTLLPSRIRIPSREANRRLCRIIHAVLSTRPNTDVSNFCVRLAKAYWIYGQENVTSKKKW